MAHNAPAFQIWQLVMYGWVIDGLVNFCRFWGREQNDDHIISEGTRTELHEICGWHRKIITRPYSLDVNMSTVVSQQEPYTWMSSAYTSGDRP